MSSMSGHSVEQKGGDCERRGERNPILGVPVSSYPFPPPPLRLNGSTAVYLNGSGATLALLVPSHEYDLSLRAREEP